MRFRRQSRCERRGHDWFPCSTSEFLCLTDICLRSGCDAKRVIKPWGTCIRGHPMAEHYTDTGECVSIETCPGPD